MLPELQEVLLQGGYREDTPAAIVYKATWPEEKVLTGTVGTLAEIGAEQGIEKTALVLVGSFLGEQYQRSKLYHPSFSHSFRRKQP